MKAYFLAEIVSNPHNFLTYFYGLLLTFKDFLFLFQSDFFRDMLCSDFKTASMHLTVLRYSEPEVKGRYTCRRYLLGICI